MKICLAVITLVLGTMASSMSALAQEEVITDPKPLEVHNGTVQDLGGTESKTMDEWLGGVGGEYASIDEASNADESSPYQVDRNSAEAKQNNLNVNLEERDANLGDVKRPTMRVPFLHF